VTLNIKTTKISLIILLLLVALSVFFLSQEFLSMREKEVIYKGPGVTEIKMLSEYFPELKGTNGDTEIYVLEGDKPGASALVLGGTHPNEPAGYLSAILLVENAKPVEGTLYVIPRANNSAFTCTDPQEGAPMRFTIETDNGERWFRFGSRATNPVDQWPDPEIYVHASSGQRLSGSETRNLNRSYPGRKDGTFTEKVSYGITELIKKEGIDFFVDLHEASPEYPTINAIVAHENSMNLASQALINMQIEGVDISLEPSPKNLHGLTHRELGDFTDTLPILMETSNPAQGRLRGRTDEALVVEGKDKFYELAAKYGRLYVPFDENGHPIDVRVARHITGIVQLANSYNNLDFGKKLVIEGIPSYSEIENDGLKIYLNHKNEEVVSDANLAEEEKSETTANNLIPSSTIEDGTIIEPWKTKGLFIPEKATTATLDTYKICEGTDVENEITVITAKEEGPTIFIIAGQHGDEVAGYTAINELKDMELIRGKLYILSPANLPGATAEPKRRYVFDEEDLNRSFPGKTDGTRAELLALAIYSEIERIKPVIVLDHHEARTIKTNVDFLGSSLIYSTLNGIEDMFLNMYQATLDGELCSGPFKFYSPGPIGSMNNVVAADFQIPVITVETYRGYQLERRIEDQLAIAGYILRHYEMVD